MGVRFLLGLAVLLLCSLSCEAEARKVALIIGNSDYAFSSPLENPANDAQIVADSAREAGFDDVMLALDLGTDAFQKTLRDFRSKADGAEVALVYYAGHGIEGQGKNWLIPVDAVLESDRDLPYEAINLDRVMETLEGAQVRVAILDACRNNPFARSWRSGTRAVSRGLVGIEVDDVLVIYAAAPGQTASDGESGNSPFATSLAERLPQPDLPLQLLGGTVRDDVLMATGGNQRPFVSASITGTPVYLVPRTEVTVPVTAAAASPTGPAVQRSGPPRLWTLSGLRVECIDRTGRLGLPDDVYLRFDDGKRYPAGKGDSYRMDNGESWDIAEIFQFGRPVRFEVMEHDDFGGDDVIGTVEMAETGGTHTALLNGDGSEYRVTYTIAPEY